MVALRVFVPFAFAYFLSYLFRTVNAVIAPDLVRDVGLDAAALGLLTSAYFLTFAAFQLPLGILLDRFGPRRTESGLLLIATAGALVFALSTNVPSLILGRALIGLGVSACLMGAFKAYVLWFPGVRLPTINGIHLAVGSIGAMTATAPVEAVLHLTDWRGVFLGLAALTGAAALLLFVVVPEREGSTSKDTLKEQIKGTLAVVSHPFFLRIAPLTFTAQGTFLAFQTLWAGPWLRDVAGFDRVAAANMLLLIALAMLVGFIVLGWAAERLEKIGVNPIIVPTVGMSLFILIQFGLVFQWTAVALPLWLVFGFFGTTGIIFYPVLTRAFPPTLSGRVVTAINLLVFFGAFAFQWGVGEVIDLWPPSGGGYAPAAYRVAFGILLALEVLSLGWFFAVRRWLPVTR
ncbi:MAG TPA: MFS transporter [Rhodospirillales bacterium]|jgi:predicted MFS family arabinose efflux permease|nr:MFS transporter [Rhodospirillales bacterium]